jgi:hypothetical protein
MPAIDDSNTIRLRLIDAVRRTLIGPNPGGPYVSHYVEHHPELGLNAEDEILIPGIHDTPGNAYKSGKLHPAAKEHRDAEHKPTQEEPGEGADAGEGERPSFEGKGSRTGVQEDVDSDEEIDPLQLANAFEPSSMGFTFKVQRGSRIRVVHRGARYEAQNTAIPVYWSNDGVLEPGLDVNGNQRYKDSWWKRVPQETLWEPDLVQLKRERPLKGPEENNGDIEFRLILRRESDQDLIVTLCVINCGRSTLFQNELVVEVVAGEGFPAYDERRRSSQDTDRQLMDLLYRDHPIHAIGHGCSVVWHRDADSRVRRISSDFLPVHSLPLVAPNTIEGLDLGMHALGREGEWPEAESRLDALADGYEKWINEIEQEAGQLPGQHQDAANRNIAECRVALRRIRNGIELLRNNVDARRCFNHMNKAMLWQQQRSKAPQRKWARGGSLEPLPDLLRGKNGHFMDLQAYQSHGPRIGRWRPFQLAFVLMNLHSAWDPSHEDRGMVDLIWFPTGGGKTEAYLGLAAFTIFARRKRNTEPHRAGTTILMRYTLRLLTTQQFERAASLILACNEIANNEGGLGGKIGIGLWVGGTSTPNTNEEARNAFGEINQNRYRFVLRKCPCCGAQMGHTDAGVKGLYIHHGTQEVRFKCGNDRCEYYGTDMPIYVVDDQIYDSAPTLVIGTVDKFASIPWNSQRDDRERMSRLFGFRDGHTRIKPPELIIQDELHLIAGPLGSMVGMYETLIKELCTDIGRYEYPFVPEQGAVFPPKIVASSATITRAMDQVQALYGSGRLQIFPPQGLDIGETWFSTVDLTPCDAAPHLHQYGRWYAGFCPADSPIRPLYRSYAAVLQELWEVHNTAALEPDPVDRYRTVVGYYNSIRELSRAKTLLGDNVPEFLGRLRLRANLPVNAKRRLALVEELTSRMPTDEIPAILKKLEQGGNMAIDVCVATNMIATGLDVARLALMFIHGQPKTTAEYIQASSRVGRATDVAPGLVFMQYNPAKPRDRSIFEHFHAYHEKLYAHVEPTSVTPFSVRVRERALHAIVFGLIRHYSAFMRTDINTQAENHQGHWDTLKTYVRGLIEQRAKSLGELNQLDDRDMDAIQDQLNRWFDKLDAPGDAARWGDMSNTYLEMGHWADDRKEQTLMMSTSKPTPELPEPRAYCLPTPTSMRQVDGVSAVKIS